MKRIRMHYYSPEFLLDLPGDDMVEKWGHMLDTGLDTGELRKVQIEVDGELVSMLNGAAVGPDASELDNALLETLRSSGKMVLAFIREGNDD